MIVLGGWAFGGDGVRRGHEGGALVMGFVPL